MAERFYLFKMREYRRALSVCRENIGSLSGAARPCCMDRVESEAALKPNRCSYDADRLRTSEVKHAVQDANGDTHLGSSTSIRARAQRVADHPFVAANRDFGQGMTVVTG